MDCSSPYAMARLIGMSDRFDIAFANDTDADRHGIVTRSGGLMNPNHYLAVAIAYLFEHRPRWRADAASARPSVEQQHDRPRRRQARPQAARSAGRLQMVRRRPARRLARLRRRGERGRVASCGATARSGRPTRTASCSALLAAEITARTGTDPGATLSTSLTRRARRLRSTSASTRRRPPSRRTLLSKLSPDRLQSKELAGEPIETVLSQAPGNGQPFGGIKVMAKSGWFAARPSGTEDVYKIYAESFRERGASARDPGRGAKDRRQGLRGARGGGVGAPSSFPLCGRRCPTPARRMRAPAVGSQRLHPPSPTSRHLLPQAGEGNAPDLRSHNDLAITSFMISFVPP